MTGSSFFVGRELLEREVAARAIHESAEAVRTTCSFARAERLLGGEYHGRFLIELLQNAADAWRQDARSADNRSRVAVIVTEEPALIVANQGVALTPQVVVESLGHIGASTKSEGEAIGHKGIGFKAVLEITSCPEVYSGLQEPGPTLAVRFNPSVALSRIKTVSPRWDEFVSSSQGSDKDDPLSPIPILRYPLWVESLPEEIQRLADEGFDTVVRLPFNAEVSPRRATKEDWINEVRRALAGLSDQILLLLGTFSEVIVSNRLDGVEPMTIKPHWDYNRVSEVAGTTGEAVSIERTGGVTTNWRIYRRAIVGEKGLAGEIAVGIRYIPGGVATVVPAVDGTPSAPFHLFFPTKISSGLPFLLHGYFQVDASRKGFHGGAQASNERILDELAKLVRDVVREVSGDEELDTASLVNLVAACPEPEDALAASFRDRALTLLDEEEWVPAQANGPTRRNARPRDFLVDSPRLTRLLTDVFSPSYVRERTKLALTHAHIDDGAIELIHTRQSDSRDLWEVLGQLCRPGTIEVWTATEADGQFRKFLALVSWLTGEYPDRTERFLEELRGDEASRLVPVVSESGGRVLLPLPDPSEGVAGKRNQLVMARIQSRGEGALVPPPELEVSFLPEGLLAAEEIIRARPLGLRQFTVDNVLDRLNGVGASTEHAKDVLSFLWMFLARERRNQYGTKKVAERSTAFNPAEWFWCRPGRARESGTRRMEQQRERYLAGVLLPNRNGEWRPAGKLAFGADWATWIEDHSEGLPSSAIQSRARAYRALEAVCPDPGEWLLAPPNHLLSGLERVNIQLTATTDASEDSDVEDEGPEDEEELDEASWDRERHAFLLRLGVWEVLPIEAFEGRDRRDGREKFPWVGPAAERQQDAARGQSGWAFGMDGWKGHQHWNVYLGEDYRFQWPLTAAAKRDAKQVAQLISAGEGLYGARLHATFFCQSCYDSGTNHSKMRQSSGADGYPSWLAIELETEAWIPSLIAGVETNEPVEPASTWWLDRVPTGQGLMTSPWRHMPVCAPSTGITEPLRRMARIATMDDATARALARLLKQMKAKFDGGQIDLMKSTDRRSFISLHAMVYERLAELPDGKSVLRDAGVLCTLGNELVYEDTDRARHDDGTFSAYMRYFVDRVPLAVIPRDQLKTARTLGIAKLTITLRREGDDEGEDVTDQVGFLAARMPELLAIVLHHSLGSQTLVLESDAFRQRAQRLDRLSVHQVNELVVHASVDVVEAPVKLGGTSSGDLFTEGATTARPILFHDFAGDGWQDRLRRKIAPHLASILEASPYSHAFTLFLQAESDAERREFLLELGISDEDVEAVSSQLGIVGEAERANRARWFTALLRVLGEDAEPGNFDHATLETLLSRTRLTSNVVSELLQAGGGDEVRRDTKPGSGLRLLANSGVDLNHLHAELRSLGSGDGLRIAEARRAFGEWMRDHERRVVAVLATRIPEDKAKVLVHELSVPAGLVLALDPPMAELLSGVAALLAPAEAGLAEKLAKEPVGTLAGLGGFATDGELDDAALRLYDVQEQRRALSASAVRWRRHIRRLAVLVRMGTVETRTGILAHDAAVGEVLGVDVERPSQLIEPVEQLFDRHPELRERVLSKLVDDVLAPEPQEAEILRWVRDLGIDDARLAQYERAIDHPANKKAAQLKSRAKDLRAAKVTATVPIGLVAPAAPKAPPGASSSGEPITVSKIKVTATFDQRKRELGDEGEQWALADVVDTFMGMNDEARASAVEDIRLLLDQFEPGAVQSLVAHASAAASPRQQDEDDDLIEALQGLLHVSRLSDGFGFDLIGWASPEPRGRPQAICLEVKSTSGAGFHLSSNEWRVAGDLRAKSYGSRYAVLAIRRRKGGGVPARMDLLVDPVGLHAAGLLELDADGYIAKYSLVR